MKEYCPLCKKTAPWINIDRSGETPRKACPTCNTSLDLGSTGRSFSFHKTVWQKVEEKRGHLSTYRRESTGKY